MPITMNSANPALRPYRCITCVAGKMPSAVPITIMANGSVAQRSDGASAAPMILPISIIIGIALMAIALMAASSHTVRNFVNMPRA